MELFKTFLITVLSMIILFFLTKIMGNRQMSQLSLFDYIVGITIGSIASEMAIAPEDYKKPMVAMITYALIAACISVANSKSVILRRVITGKPTILFEDGKLYKKNLQKSKLDVGEFLTQCRNNGYFDLNQIYAAILESNGKISFLPAEAQRPVTPRDLNLTPSQDKLVADVIVDGKIMKGNLKCTGNDETWLQSQLHDQGVESISEVFLATCDGSNKLSIYRKFDEELKKDIFS